MRSSILGSCFDVLDLPVVQRSTSRQINVLDTATTLPPNSSDEKFASESLKPFTCNDVNGQHSGDDDDSLSDQHSISESEAPEGTAVHVDTAENGVTTNLHQTPLVDEQETKFHGKLSCNAKLEFDLLSETNDLEKEVLHYRLLEANKQERARYLNEVREMRWEDIRSDLLMRNLNEKEAYEKSICQNRGKIRKLRKDREEDNIFELHDSVALSRAQTRERLRQSIDSRNVSNVKNDESENSTKGRPIPLQDMSQLDNYCKCVLRDLLRCREQMVTAKSRQEAIQQKINSISTECEDLERAVEISVRKIHLSKKASMESETSQDFSQVCKEHERKQYKLSEVKAVLLEQQEQLSEANRTVQDLRVLCNEKADYLSKLIEALRCMEKQTKLKLLFLREQQEGALSGKTNKNQKCQNKYLDELGNRTILMDANEETKLKDELRELGKVQEFLNMRWERLRKEKSLLIPAMERMVDGDTSSFDNNSVAQKIREKQQSLLSLEEKKWIGMDFKINRDLYAGCNYIHEIECNEEYCISDFDECDVRRLLSCPDQIQKALPFLRNHSEVEAHKILMHYTRGKSELFFKEIDLKSPADQGSTTKTRVAACIGDLAGLEPCNNSNSRVVVASDATRQIIYEANLSLKRRECRIHKFEICEEDKQVNLALTIVIIFHGQLLENGIYQPGRISASLSRIVRGISEHDESIGLGFSPYNLQEVNSEDTFGRLVILHQPMKTIHPGMFEVLIQNESLATNYSIKVDATMGHDARTVLEKEYQSCLLKQKNCTLLQAEINDIQTTIRLTDRKLSVLKSLLDDSNSEIRRCRAEMDVYEDALDETVAELSDYHFNLLPRKISLLELEFLHWSKLSNIREQELRNTKAKISQLSRIKRDRQRNVSKLQAGTENSKALILKAMEAIIGPGSTEEEIQKFNEDQDVADAAVTVAKCYSQLGEGLQMNVDKRCRQILVELDKAANNVSQYMDSSVLHVAPQRFPTKVIRIDLERELDRLLREEIFRLERAQPYLGTNGHTKRTIGEIHDDEEGNKHESSTRKQRRSKKRYLRGKAKYTTNQIESEIEGKKRLGFGGCLACKQNSCVWVATETDTSHLIERKDVLSNELFSISKSQDQSLCSTIAASSLRGGSTRFRRQDLVSELLSERKNIEGRLSLYEVDKELHDAFASTKPYVEVRSLHGYNTLLSTVDARIALQREHNRLVAIAVGTDIVEDILEWMLDGWYFGERESLECTVGYVPSLKSYGPVRSGTESVKAFSILKKRSRHPSDLVDDSRRGTEKEKIEPITGRAQERLAKESSKIEAVHRRKALDTAEQSTKFGLFCLTFMYFRALYLVRTEKDSWSGRNDIFGSKENHVTRSKRYLSEERVRMIEEKHNKAERKAKMDYAMAKARVGEERKSQRFEKEKSRTIQKFQENKRRAKKERISTLTIQRYFRGYVGRKDAENWAKERATIEALQALQNSSAITIARIWRGTLGRRLAKSTRNRMIEFIANVRTEEAVQDEQDYW
eukprot:CAMPEP_0196807812 /NCGR_PEP_ID=MMETSP1362-20130617/7802_1 /TAXON_ID=163516 /ORGANISM="Leptocylindrus danicus, Strain CCMP1856" /LENGTH=1509 /DNA_ID=CAMNT_0042181887 /DNA_START=1363 /DNA_END=5889 /DNA_ORIENTATION=+